MAHPPSSHRYDLQQIGDGFWNVRRRFRILAKLFDIETHMSFIRLSNGKFLVIDTIDLNDQLQEEINHLTNNGDQIEAVLAVHPFHTLSMLAFYEKYPHLRYYGTPRHQRRIKDIPWVGTFDQCHHRNQWWPDVELRIPAGSLHSNERNGKGIRLTRIDPFQLGAEFVNPHPESSNHVSRVFVYHRLS